MISSASLHRRVSIAVASAVAVAVGVVTALAGVALPAQADDPSSFTTVGTASISGQPYVGDCLTAETANWDPTPDGFAYQWLRDGSPIDGATTSRYKPTADDLDAHLSVTVTGSKSGYSDTPTTSAESDAIQQPGTLDSSQPTISGDPVVGNELSADAGQWGPGNVTLSYLWMSNGAVVQHGSSAEYTPTSADVDNAITVKVKGSEPAYATTTSTSEPTAAVARAPLTTDTPSISGDTFVGGTLTAHAGNWGPGNVTFDYAWSNASGTQLQDGASATYVPVGGDAGTTIKVKVTGSEPGFVTASQTSAPTASIANGTLTSSVPTITGAAAVGSTLTASPGNWGPGSVSFDYTWYSSTGSQLQDGHSATYTPVAGDQGNTITVTVTGSETGYDTVFQTSSATSTVVPGTLTQGTPTLTGTAAVGSTLTASPGNWGPGSVTFSYVWSSGGTILTGVTGTSYTLQPTDAGNVISVAVTGSETGFTSSTQNVASGPVALGTISPAPIPTITGMAVVGSPLTAQPGTWGNGATLDYLWQSGTTTLQDGPGPTYAPKPADVGKAITVTVTGSAPGYANSSQTSAPTSPVVKGTLAVSPAPTITGTPTFTQTLTANAPASAWGPGTVSVANQWLLDGNAIAGQTGQTYTPVASDVGHSVSLQVTGSEDGYTAKTVVTNAMPIGAAMFTSAPQPTLSQISFQKRITAVTTGWTPSPDSYVYKWYRNNVLQPSATGVAYQLTPDDFGGTISVIVTGVKAGYLSATPAQSAQSGVIQPFSATFTNSVPPSVSGVYDVGSTLTAIPGTWDPMPDSYSYIWQRGTGDPNGAGYTTIQGQTGPQYTLTAADLNQSVIVRVTAIKANYTSKTLPSDQTDPVALGTITGTTPTITGTAQVGVPLTANPGTWSPSGVSFEYIWKSGSNTLQDGASPTYTPIGTDAGNAISVTVVGTAPGYQSNTQVSSVTAAVAKGQFTSTPVPTISGTATPGSTLTATVPAWTPTSTFSYQWYIDGAPATNATNSTFVVPLSAAGHSITVAATSTLTGYTAVTRTSAALAIAQLTFGTPPTPKISGSAKVGSSLTASAGTWTPITPSFMYQWTVAGVSDQPSDTDNTFVPTAADAGHTVTVTVTGSSAGYASRTSPASAATAKIATGTLVTATPTVSTTKPVVNKAVSANTGTWSPGTSFTYQWYRATTAIGGATASTYTPTGSDYGHTLKVKVTGSLAGFTTTAVSSKSTSTVGKGTLTTTTPTISGTVAVGSVLTASVAPWQPAPVTLKYQWYRKSSTGSSYSAISKATGHTYTLTSSSYKYTLKVKVTGSKTGYTSVSATSDPTAAVTKGDFTASPAPTISGSARVGSKLTASHGSWSPSTSLTYAYQWYRIVAGAPVAIVGKTSSTYTLTSADAGSTVFVIITVSKLDYNPTPSSSQPTTTVTAN